MKNKNRIIMLIITLGLIFVISNSNLGNFSNNREMTNGSKEIQEESNLKNPKTSGWWNNFSFIHIDGNWSIAAGYGWCSGDGSWGNPYTIDNITMDASSSPTGSGIFINNSKNEYFIIENCTVYNAGGALALVHDAGIRLENTNNGTITNNNCSNNGSDNNGNGILLYNYCENNTISGNIASNIGTTNQFIGIFLRNNCFDNIITNNSVNGNDYGMSIWINCDNNRISNNSANGNLVDGIRIYDGCNDNTVSGNNVSHNTQNGIYLRDGCNDNTVSGNTLNDNADMGIYLRDICDGNTISGNTANENGDYGMWLDNDCDYNDISGNIANNNTKCGIYIDTGCNGNTISGNIANNNSIYGIYLWQDCHNNIISGNTVNDNVLIGLYIDFDCDGNTVLGNTASNIGTTNQYNGIYLWDDCDGNTISGNTVNDNAYRGIRVENNCNGNTVSGNTVNDNTDTGIYLGNDCDNNIISGNLIKNNKNYGIRIEMGTSINNLIYQNSLIGNVGWHARDSGTNTQWNTAEIGNYWDNHTSPDLNNDGIVDTPYTWIPGGANSEDSFPLAESPFHLGEIVHVDESGVSSYTWSITAKVKVWCTGSGMYSDPYVIDNLEIDGGGMGSGIFIENSKNDYFLIKNCTVYNAGSGPTDAGIKLENSNNGNLTNNNCSDNGCAGIILIYDCNNNTISENTASNNEDYGVWIADDCNNNTISENTASNDGTTLQNVGIYLNLDCDNNTILGNTANDNMVLGIQLDNGCDNNTISGNTANDNGGLSIYDSGIYLDACDDNTISGNTANDNNDFGIYIENYCDNNTIRGNVIGNNGVYGLLYDASATGNRAFLNNFTNNGYHAHDEGSYNRWDNGNIGNYWDNYIGADKNDNGIGDTPYNIPGAAGSQDFLPICWDAPVLDNTIPLMDTKFYSKAPTFEIRIEQGLGDYFWYEILGIGKIMNLTKLNGVFNENFTGSINQTLWSRLPYGKITIRFSCNDTRDYIGYLDVDVYHTVAPPQNGNGNGNGKPPPPPPPPWELYITIGAIIAGSAIIIIIAWKKNLLTKLKRKT